MPTTRTVYPSAELSGDWEQQQPIAVDGSSYTEPRVVATDTASYLQQDAKSLSAQNGQLVLPEIDNPPGDISYVGSLPVDYVETAKTTVAFTIPATFADTSLALEAGDLIEISVSTQENSGSDPGTPTMPSPWLLRDSTLSAAAYKPHITTFYKIANGAEIGQTFNVSIPTGVFPSGVWTHGVLEVWRGVDEEQPYQSLDPRPFAIGSTGSNPNPPALGLTTQGGMTKATVVGNFQNAGYAANVSPGYSTSATQAPDERAFVNCFRLDPVGTVDPGAYSWQVQNWTAVTDVLKPKGGSVKMLAVIGVGDQQATDEISSPVPSVAARNEVQTITNNGQVGNFTLTFGGETTAAISPSATAADIQSALETLSSITSTDVSCTGGALDVDPIQVEFIGVYANINVGMLASNSSDIVTAQLVVGSQAEDFSLAGTINIPRAGGARQPQAHVWSIEVSNYVAGKVIDMTVSSITQNLHTWTAALLVLQDVDMETAVGATLRDRLLHPFSVDSFWNQPISDSAVYVDAQIPVGVGELDKITADQNLVMNDPTQPLTDILESNLGWQGVTTAQDRVDSIADPAVVLFSAPVDPTFNTVGATERLNTKGNHATSWVGQDGNTINQGNAVEFDTASGQVCAFNHSVTEYLDGEGRLGGHGGSKLSSLGGTIRVGEWVSGGVIDHPIQTNLWAAKTLWYDATADLFRWPADRADGYAANLSHANHYVRTTVPELKMGALLALKPDFDIDSLTNEAAKILARAFQDYGGYVVDDTTREVVSVSCEWGPDGSVGEEFETSFGFAINSTGATWVADIRSIYGALHVVDNNTETTPGGGPLGEDVSNRRAAYALPLAPVGGAPAVLGSLAFGTEEVGTGTLAEFGSITPTVEGSKVVAVVMKGMGLEEWYQGQAALPEPPVVPSRYTLAAEAVSDSQTMSLFLSPPLDDVAQTPGDSPWVGADEKWATGLFTLLPLVASTSGFALADVVNSADETTYLEVAGVAGHMYEVLEFDLSSLGANATILGASIEFAHKSGVRNKLRMALVGINADDSIDQANEFHTGYEPAPVGETQTVLTPQWTELANGASIMGYDRLGVAFFSTEIHPALTSHQIFWVRAVLEVEEGGPVVTLVTPPDASGDPVAWTYSSASGLLQSHYQVMVIAGADGDPASASMTTNALESPAGDVILDTGKVTDSLARSVIFSDKPLGRSTNTWAVRTWARLESGVELVSDWLTKNHNIPGNAPDQVSAPVVPVFNESTGSVDLGFTTPSIAQRAWVIRSVDAGVSWQITPESPYAVSPSTVTVIADSQVPLNADALYKVSVDDGPMSESSTPKELSAIAVNTAITSWYLQAPGQTSLNMAIDVDDFRQKRRANSAIAEQAPEGDYAGGALVATSGSLGDILTIRIRTLDKVEKARLKAILSADVTLRLINIYGEEWLVRPVGDREHSIIPRIKPLPSETSPVRDAALETVVFREVRR